MTDGWRETCLQCDKEFGSRSQTNFCARCCHDGLDDDLLDEHGVFVHGQAEEDDGVELDLDVSTQTQTGLGDFA